MRPFPRRRVERFDYGALCFPDGDGSEGRRVLVLSPPRAMLPSALLVWAAPGTVVRRLRIDSDDQLLCPVPARSFQPRFDWAEFLTFGQTEDGILLFGERLPPHFQFDLPAAAPGSVVSLELDGGYEHAALAGRIHRP